MNTFFLNTLMLFCRYIPKILMPLPVKHFIPCLIVFTPSFLDALSFAKYFHFARLIA